MGRWLSFALFFVVALLIVGSWHWYLWLRLVRDPAWPTWAARSLTGLIVFLGLLVPGSMIASRLLPPKVAEPIAYAGYLWMGVGFLLLVLVAGLDVARLLAEGAQRLWASLVGGPGLPSPERRLVLARSMAVAAGAGAVATGLAGVRGALGEITTPEVVVPLRRLPKALEGLSVVQLSDVHVGPLIGRRFIEGLVEKTNAMKPDAVVITGDLVDGDVKSLMSQVEPLRRLTSRYGTYFVTGNHEYYSGVSQWLEALRKMGIHVLENERAVLGDAGASIDLAGIPDPTGAGMGPEGPDLAKALEGRDPERELLLLAHQPKQVEMAVPHEVGLMLSGHTHGGQIWPFGALVALAQPWVAGLHEKDGTQVYVSRGTGFWGPPMRVLAPAEITRVVLVGA